MEESKQRSNDRFSDRYITNFTSASALKVNFSWDRVIFLDVEVNTFRDTGMSHKLRSLFERAVDSRVGRHSPLLWRLYLRFEQEEDNLRAAEGVYYRALQSCPWAKVHQ